MICLLLFLLLMVVEVFAHIFKGLDAIMLIMSIYIYYVYIKSFKKF